MMRESLAAVEVLVTHIQVVGLKLTLNPKTEFASCLLLRRASFEQCASIEIYQTQIDSLIFYISIST